MSAQDCVLVLEYIYIDIAIFTLSGLVRVTTVVFVFVFWMSFFF